MKYLSIEGRVEWKYFRDVASGYWIAVCEPLKQTVSAQTWAELNESIAETLDLLIRELTEKNELESFLRTHGWTIASQQEVPRSARNVRFDVPWKLVQRRRAYDPEAALCQ